MQKTYIRLSRSFSLRIHMASAVLLFPLIVWTSSVAANAQSASLTSSSQQVKTNENEPIVVAGAQLDPDYDAKIKRALDLCTQGERAQAEQQAAAAASLLEQGKGFDLKWVWGGSLAETHYEFARYHATARDSRATVESLAAAARWGWSDPEAVRSDPAFSRPAIAPHLETVLATMTRKPLPR